MFDATAEWMAVPLIHQEQLGKAPARVGVRHPSIAPYGAFTTGDGKGIIVGIQNEREWQRFCAAVLGEAALASDPRFCDNVQRVANRPALDGLIAAALRRRRTREEVAALLDEADIAFGRLNSVADLAAHPQLRRITATMGGADHFATGPARRWRPGSPCARTRRARSRRSVRNLPDRLPVSLRRSTDCTLSAKGLLSRFKAANYLE